MTDSLRGAAGFRCKHGHHGHAAAAAAALSKFTCASDFTHGNKAQAKALVTHDALYGAATATYSTIPATFESFTASCRPADNGDPIHIVDVVCVSVREKKKCGKSE